MHIPPPSSITSEDDFLACIAAKFPNEHASLILGRGDDCAEIACPPHMAVSTDLFVEDIHFRRAYFSPFETGYKAMAVNISDMAAAGARPIGVSVGLIAPVPFPREEAEGILEGMLHAVKPHDIALTGGDLSRGEKLAFCVTIWGAPASLPLGPPFNPEDRPPRFLRRGPVMPGDTLFACGALGLARAGLLALEEHGKDAARDFPLACAAHRMPVPRVAAGLALAAIPGCRLMDVSDGLARDLPRMLAAYGADCGAAITLPETALHPEVVACARNLKMSPERFAFYGGEEYALLGACPPERFDQVAAALRDIPDAAPFLPLGRITRKKGITLNGAPLPDAGFDHFSNGK